MLFLRPKCINALKILGTSNYPVSRYIYWECVFIFNEPLRGLFWFPRRNQRIMCRGNSVTGSIAKARDAVEVKFLISNSEFWVVGIPIYTQGLCSPFTLLNWPLSVIAETWRFYVWFSDQLKAIVHFSNFSIYISWLSSTIVSLFLDEWKSFLL